MYERSDYTNLSAAETRRGLDQWLRLRQEQIWMVPLAQLTLLEQENTATLQKQQRSLARQKK